jgi:hypothetical protein
LIEVKILEFGVSAMRLDSSRLFALCSPMGAKDPNRQPRLRGLRNTPDGWIRVASCNKCRHKGPLPVDALIRKFGDLALVEFALVGLKCTACGHIGASALMLRLCEPGCPRQR